MIPGHALFADPIFELRRAVPSDASAIRVLTRAAYAKWVPLIGREPKPMVADYAVAVRDHRIDLLQVAGELAALVETVAEPGCLLIVNVAVAPEFQGRGHGSGLIAHAERLAMALDHVETRLYTNALFTENIGLYQRLGYRIDREEAFKGGRLVHMRKSLSASAFETRGLPFLSE
jgi:ribosomal protein S18 acetylase RimI-like enzyme